MELALRKGGHSSRAAASDYPLTGRIIGGCGHHYVGAYRKTNDTRYYRCGGGNNGKGRATNCTDPYLTADDVETVVWKRIEALLNEPGAMAAATGGRPHLHPGDIDRQRERVARFEESLKEREEHLVRAETALVRVPGLDRVVRDAAVRQLTGEVRSARELLAMGREVLESQEAAQAAGRDARHHALLAGTKAAGVGHADLAALCGFLDIVVKPLGQVRKRSGVKCKVTAWHEGTGTLVPAEVPELDWAGVEELMAAHFTRRQFVRGAVDIRTQLNGALHRLRTGCLWDELPERYGPWQLAKDRQNTWFTKGFWPVLMPELVRRGGATPVQRE
ncbi:transposase, partial [Streptomyces anandii]